MDSHETLVRVGTMDSEVEANALDAALQAEEIPHMVQSFYDAAYDGVFQQQKGWGVMLAPAPHVTRAKELLESLRRGDQKLDDAP